MPKTKKADEATANVPKTPIERDLENAATPHNTGPNVDNGYVAGLVTVDPETAQGRAAAANREANGATVVEHDNGIVEVTEGMLPTPEATKVTGMADPNAPAVDDKSQKAKDVDPTTIANEPDDIKADPKADIQ